VFLKFLEFCYCEKVLQQISGFEAHNLHIISKKLGLTATAKIFETMSQCINIKIEDELIKDLN
jgi:hypothetical protein